MDPQICGSTLSTELKIYGYRARCDALASSAANLPPAVRRQRMMMDPHIQGPMICGSTYLWIHGSVDARICRSTDLWIYESVHGATMSGGVQGGATMARRRCDDTTTTPRCPWSCESKGQWIHGSVDPWSYGCTDLWIHKSADGATTSGGGQDDATVARQRHDNAAMFF